MPAGRGTIATDSRGKDTTAVMNPLPPTLGWRRCTCVRRTTCTESTLPLAARYGKHILVEKPIARTVAEGRAIIQGARTAGVTLMVAENFRFMAQVRRCKELVSGGEVGKLRHVQLQEEAPFIPGGWRSDRSHNGGGVFIDGGIHKVHFLR